jgi:ABC-type Na+ efflux pump permease subunit
MDDLREKYIQGKLTEAEQKAFENNLTSEERKEIAFELGVRDGLENQLKKELRNKVAGFESKKTRVRKLNPAYISIAASIFLVSSLILYFTRDQSSLFDQYYTVYPNYELTVVRGEEDLSDRQLAYAAYDNEDYENAISEFNKLETLVVADYFFRGISYVEVENYDLALVDFAQVMNSNEKEYGTASEWYSALIHIQLERKNLAIPLLEKLSAGNSEYAISSTRLLSEF